MKIKTAVGAALLGTLIGLSQAFALDTPATATGAAVKAKYEAEYGRALPPIGYVNFCGRNPGDCQANAKVTAKVAMSPDRWNLLFQVNSYVNGKIAPVSDQDLYGQPEFWAYPTDAGDCEDYVLLKQRFLENLGFPASALLITVVLDEKNEGHAVLTVATDAGDYILDNRRDDVLRWSDTAYTYLKRQSKADPKSWVALAKEKTMTAGFVSGGKTK
jgi:predicted transglutaminase-like cysteine proteinase